MALLLRSQWKRRRRRNNSDFAFRGLLGRGWKTDSGFFEKVNGRYVVEIWKWGTIGLYASAAATVAAVDIRRIQQLRGLLKWLPIDIFQFQNHKSGRRIASHLWHFSISPNQSGLWVLFVCCCWYVSLLRLPTMTLLHPPSSISCRPPA